MPNGMTPKKLDQFWPEMANYRTSDDQKPGWEDRPLTFVLTPKGAERQASRRQSKNIIGGLIVFVVLFVMFAAIFYLAGIPLF